ncbi:hypothetical protein RN001_013223 [Aquatica leii]|uniref:Cytosolic endo-beta-N-acetylglucosaminidase n=1 Tax=Aquatica leii TaxID=1421715 RepID=A0AAN7P2G2_9COLE|nr:hypothetical protein RN001_013223 [Aquatica leii]
MKRTKLNISDNTTSKKKSFEHDSKNICAPITSLEDAWNYTESPPDWVQKIIELKPRSNFVIQNSTLSCHSESHQFTPSTRVDRRSTPRTLVCHDMKGGYIEDKFVEPINSGNGYTFYRWSQIDIFVYFSHHLITIPPISWINAAHSNGVKILGTFITEWKPGKEICKQIFKDSQTLMKFINVLVDICVLFKLDGWLLNIENEVDEIDFLQSFVKELTQKIHDKHPGSLIIWYDSVINDGNLKWQNELNYFNSCYFNECDGIFLNYSWNEDNLKNTVKSAEHRTLDVYVGVDVFGRNFFGGGNFNTYLAVEQIRKYGLSMAIFAQGWTHETLAPEPSHNILERFLIRDNAFWKSLWPYLYTHPINRLFETFFYVGVDKDWFKLHHQEVQLSQCLQSNEILEEATTVSTLTGTCNCLQLYCHGSHTLCCVTNKSFESDQTITHHLFSCDIKVSSGIIIYCYYKLLDESVDHYLNLILLVQNDNGSVSKIICQGNKKIETESNRTIMEVNFSEEEEVLGVISKDRDVPLDWVLRCYLLQLNSCHITEIGAAASNNSSICLCGIGIKEAPL